MKPNADHDQPSGRFLLRVGSSLHRQLREAAARLGISLNEYCTRKLSVPGGLSAALPGVSDALRCAEEMFGEALVGAAVFGSRARGNAGASSDLDLLVVLMPSVRLHRGLYRRWQQATAGVDLGRVETHFVHLPPKGATAGGIWPEVALDGIVLFDPALGLSAVLIGVRRDIVAGKLERKVVHGQPYWATRVGA